MPQTDATRHEARRLLGLFTARGAVPVETDILQPAGPLLDLYGEDIRARAFTLHDPLRGETMLRPDMTLPVLRRHLAEGAEPARYAYSGEVFRRQEAETGRPSEYLQVGYEVLGGGADADAEVLSAVIDALEGTGAELVTGDIGLLIAATRTLRTSERRRAALLRHIWRPQRFAALLATFSAPTAPRDLDAAEAAIGDSPEIGARGAGEVRERLAALRAEADQPPIPGEQVDALNALLALSGPTGTILGAMAELTGPLPGLTEAARILAERAEACTARGLPDLPFAAAEGRGALEYYDGMVFAAAAPGHPVVATGGRYDALVRALDAGRAVPAAGVAIRPAVTAALRAA